MSFEYMKIEKEIISSDATLTQIFLSVLNCYNNFFFISYILDFELNVEPIGVWVHISIEIFFFI